MQKQRPPVRKPLLLISAHFFLQMGQAFKRLIERLVLLGKVDADDAVSYTHLDVYKRQKLNRTTPCDKNFITGRFLLIVHFLNP